MRRFIRLWQAAKSLKHAARILKLSPDEVLSTAVVLRLEGIVLKPLNVGPRLFASWWNSADTVEDLRVMLGFTDRQVRRHRFTAACCGYLLRFLPDVASARFVAYQDALALEAMGEPGRN